VDAQDIITSAIKKGRRHLTEVESKQFLKHYNIPVVDEIVVDNVEEAVRQAERLGYPVVLKGYGAQLMHKTEQGLVRLDLKSADDVSAAAASMAATAGKDLEGFLVQPMITGRREFVAGLFRDEQFGPVIMFGLGGIFTEALEDIVFRLAPLTADEAAAMVQEIHATKLLGSFRGEPAANHDQLVKALVGLSRLATEQPQIKEIDINPLLVRTNGDVTAVDALIVFAENGASKPVDRQPINPRAIGSLFYPKSIAFVGASAAFGKWGYLLFTNVLAGHYKGNIYLVNGKEKEIAGRPVYPSVLDIPDPVDLAVVTIPAGFVLDLIPQFKAKGIRKMILISSGFSETGEQGRLLEEELAKRAEEAGILILGPNTMGVCNPDINFYCMAPHMRPKSGTTSLVAQSGNLGTQLLAFAADEGIGIRAFSGSGNEAMITIEDYMHCLEVDDLTRTVVLYLESIKDGRRFSELARQVGHKKPVIVLKGGRTEAGSRAAASHTGAMASNTKIFNAACHQAGVVLAEQPMDLLDLSAAFSSMPLPAGNRVAIMTLGGGWGVVATDLCAESGLVVPHLSRDIIDKIDKVLPPYWSRSNPIDLVGELDPQIPMLVMEELAKWDGCDAIMHLGCVGRMIFVRKTIESALATDPNQSPQIDDFITAQLKAYEKKFTEFTVQLMATYRKPIVGVYLIADDTNRMITDVEGQRYKGVTFLSPERAVKALARMYEYQSWLKAEASAGRCR
jgi:acyl-CoA synthetase (NDP forming)